MCVVLSLQPCRLTGRRYSEVLEILRDVKSHIATLNVYKRLSSNYFVEHLLWTLYGWYVVTIDFRYAHVQTNTEMHIRIDDL